MCLLYSNARTRRRYNFHLFASACLRERRLGKRTAKEPLDYSVYNTTQELSLGLFTALFFCFVLIFTVDFLTDKMFFSIHLFIFII